MDRILLGLSSLILSLLIFVLLGELEIIPYKIIEFSVPLSVNSKPIGYFSEVSNKVQKQPANNLLWFTARKSDLIYSQDTVLTQDFSHAKLNLDNNTSIQLGENTLVVINIIQQEKDKLEVELSQGQIMARNGNSPLQMTHKQKKWRLNIQKNSEVSVQKQTDDSFEFEISKGSASIQSKDSKPIQLNNDQKVVLHEDHIQTYKISQNLQWVTESKTEYGDLFPIPTQLEWKGSAKNIEIYHDQNPKKIYPLQSDQNSLVLPLQAGVYKLTLVSDNEQSKSLNLTIRKVPEVNYYAPLPRERFTHQQKTIFSWTSIPQAKKYVIQFSQSPDFLSEVEEISSPLSYHEGLPQMKGRIYWRVKVITNENAEFFGQEKRLFFTLDNALSPPQLNTPKINPRIPANEKPKENKEGKKNKLNDNAWNFIFDLILPKMFAEEPLQDHSEKSEKQFTSDKKIIILNWLPVAAATHYYIEISQEESFKAPIVSQKVQTSFYEWDISTLSIEKNTPFFWRVAAGGDNDMMGLFSEVSSFNLNSLLKNEHKNQNNVKLKVVKVATPKPQPMDLPETPKIEKPTQEVFPSKGIKNITALFFSTDTQFQEQQTQNDFFSRLKGFSKSSINLESQWEMESKSIFLFYADYTSS
ncbi:MAG: hypothetical protein KDD50_10925, partial [Bdellovibrionales bacterium]|nr:hypothetical protein [Bdellovibrionales bacterium]